MLNALYFDVLNYTEDNIQHIQKYFTLLRAKSPDDITEEMLSKADLMFVPLGYEYNSEFFKKCPNLKVIATNTTGTPHINSNDAESLGIKVISLKDKKEFLETITPTAEHTIGLMLCITRNVISSSQSVLNGEWSRWNHGGNTMLSRMTLGIIGIGRLGKMVAKYAKAMGMAVLYYDPYANDQLSELTSYKKCNSLYELAQGSDIVSIHIPMCEENKHIVNADVLSKFRKGAYFINTARGELVDNLALLEMLENGHLAGAAVDVLDGEFDPEFEDRVASHPLVEYARNHNNLIITPHIAGSTRDAWNLTQKHTIEQAVEHLFK